MLEFLVFRLKMAKLTVEISNLEIRAPRLLAGQAHAADQCLEPGVAV
jgi:hypothetical protein